MLYLTHDSLYRIVSKLLTYEHLDTLTPLSLMENQKLENRIRYNPLWITILYLLKI